MKKIVIIYFGLTGIVFLLFSACNMPLRPMEPTSEALAVETSIQAVFPSSVPSLPSVTPTRFAPSPFPTATATQSSVTPIPSALQDILHPPECLDPIDGSSPNGDWYWVVCQVDPEKGFAYTRISNLEGKSVYNLEVDPSQFSLDNERYWPDRWTQDGKWLYLKTLPMGGDQPLFLEATSLVLLNLENGRSRMILPGDGFGYYDYAISPDDGQVAYIPQNENQVRVVVQDVLKGDLIRPLELEKRYQSAGNLTWAGDGKSLLLVAERNVKGSQAVSDLLSLSVKDMALEAIYRGDLPFYILEWNELENKVKIGNPYQDYEEWISLAP